MCSEWVQAVDLDTGIWISAGATEAVLIGLLLYRRAWRKFPVFFVYSLWTLFSGVATYFILRYCSLSSPAYATTYVVETIVDAALMFAVLVELAWSVLRPLRGSLPSSALIVVAGLILAAGAVIWPFAAFTGAAHLSRELAALARLQQTCSILQIVVFLALVGSSQFLSIGWRNREMQIATGLGLFSFVGLAAAVLRTHQSTWAQYSHLNQIVVTSYLCCLIYWVVSFAQKEAERREFTPQMQSMLLAVAGAARSTRVALEGSHGGKAPKQEKR